ncbi:uncharacterized protein [Solanum lycopersicum]|uniref:uncharacterized protein n=1 Tax=Solanum lycopersicum TaxID=4081 RepID=UPI000532EEAA|nr:uncharacterized protein LOC104644961 [Solanum lycopersicum]
MDPQKFIDEVLKVLGSMGVSSQEKMELAAYQLKDVAQVRYEQENDERLSIAGQITWGAFKTTSLDRLFPLELRERNMEEFINHILRGMIVKEYSLKCTQLSKHAPTMVADSRAKMNKCFIGIFYLVVNECRSDMLIPSMEIYRLMLHAEQIEEQKLKKVGRELKKVRIKEGKGGRFYVDKPLCANYDKRRDCKFLIVMCNCYGYGKSGHIKRY